MSNIYDNINKLYTSGSFLDKYMSDILITIIVCIIVFLIVSYYYVMNHMQKLKANWTIHRCDPSVIPFAGLINKPSNQTAFEYTKTNFEKCTQSILQEITKYAFLPIYYAMNAITEVFSLLKESLVDIRSVFDKIRGSVDNVGRDLYARLLNIMMPITKLFIYIKDIFGKGQAVLTAGIYMIYASYITTNSLFMTLYNLIIEFMIGAVAFIITCFAIGWLFPPTLAVGLAASGAMVVLVVMLAIFMNILNEVFDAGDLKKPPLIPSYCFGENTLIKMNDYSLKKIKNIKVGDVLSNNNVVTATMKSSLENLVLCNLNNVIVTSNHKILYKNNWINAIDHPDSIITNYNGDAVYCLNTSHKQIIINNTIFGDWDEMDHEDFIKITQKNNNIKNLINLHQYLDVCIHPKSKIKLKNGKVKTFENLKLGDVLANDEKIKSIIKINSNDIMYDFYTYFANDNEIITCSDNLNYNISRECLNKYLNIKQIKCDKPNIGYNIITDKGEFKINDFIIKDYNYCVEKYL